MPSLYIALPFFTRSPRIDNLLQQLPLDVVFNPTDKRPSPTELARLLQEHDALLIGIKEHITAELLSTPCCTKLIGSLSIGLDHIDAQACERAGIQVVNASQSNVTSVAEHTIGCLLTLRKELIHCDEVVRSGGGRAALQYRPRDLADTTVGIVGAGAIARQVIQWLRPFGVHVLVWTFHPERHTDLLNTHVQFAPSIDVLFAQSDAVSLHLPSTAQSRGMITEALLQQTTKRPFALINTSRADILAPGALQMALATGTVSHAALDVYDPDEVADLPAGRVLLSPHIAGVTPESLERMGFELVQHLKNTL